MTIAKPLVILLAVPLFALLGLGIFVRYQSGKVESSTRFLSESQIPSLAVLGNLSRTVEGLRVSVRNHLLATNAAEQAKARAAFDAAEADVQRLLGKYSDSLISSDRDRRLLGEYNDSSRDYIAGARQVMNLSEAGRQQEALALLNGSLTVIAQRLKEASSAW